jgi:KAP family P-loop domain
MGSDDEQLIQALERRVAVPSKTTVLYFIRWFAGRAGLPVVLFKPWIYQNTTDAWAGFIQVVDESIALCQNQTHGPFLQRHVLRRVQNWIARAVAWLVGHRSVSEVFQILQDVREGKSLSFAKSEVDPILQGELRGRPLIILIDDLDRAPTDIVYDTLLLIKEIINIPNCVLVCAYDELAVGRTLRRRAIPDVTLFTEKIFQWPIALPDPTESDKEVFFDAQVRDLPASIERDAILQIRHVFPAHNPRKLKAYFRRIVSLQTFFLRRFSADDLNWKLVYFC